MCALVLKRFILWGQPRAEDRITFILRCMTQRMPPTLEAKCTNDACELDMVTLHFTYEMPSDVTAADFQCPHCASDVLEAIEV